MDLVEHICKPSTGQAETGYWGIVKTPISVRDPIPKNKVESLGYSQGVKFFLDKRED